MTIDGTDHLQRLKDETTYAANRLIRPMMWAFFALYLALSFLYEPSIPGTILFLLLNVAMEALLRLDGTAPATRCYMGFLVMAAPAALIDLVDGATWMHFMVFTNLAFLLAYRDWRVILAAEVTIALHHLAFNYLQAYGAPVMVFPPHMVGLHMVAIHALFVVFECAVLFHICRSLVQNLEDRVAVETTLAQVMQVKGVSRNNAKIQHGIEQIVGANRELTQRSARQADDVRAMTAHLETFSGKLQDTVRQSEEVSGLASSAVSGAEQGHEVVRELIASIESLAASSQQVFEIVDVIEGIAYQTNLLAINASVEAARAGEQGRSFAVVAAEVRDLASRSSDSSREIRQIIEDNVNQVNRGVDLATRSGASLTDIVERVQRVSRVMHDLRGANGQQADSLGDIRRAIESVDAMTEQNIAMAADIERSSEQLHAESADLARRMDEALSRV
ncbi:MAG: hypothetical protein GVY21_09055 [Gammaproteobacteria bacterium]|jgi:methyl-accepting chemotaxis protein|nr:hypothetical protein [Gammaproteobacteria bacterium]